MTTPNPTPTTTRRLAPPVDPTPENYAVLLAMYQREHQTLDLATATLSRLVPDKATLLRIMAEVERTMRTEQ